MLFWAVLLETALLAGLILGVVGLIHWKDQKKPAVHAEDLTTTWRIATGALDRTRRKS
jgi:hypothetical protein